MRRLRLNSVNDVFPGGPVSVIAGAKKTLGGAETRISPNLEGGRSPIAGARFFAGAFATARRILQHSIGCDFGFVGLE